MEQFLIMLAHCAVVMYMCEIVEFRRFAFGSRSDAQRSRHTVQSDCSLLMLMSKRDVALWDDDGSAVPNKIESRQKQQVLTLLQSANDYSNENQVVKYQIQSKSGSDLSVLSSLPLPAD